MRFVQKELKWSRWTHRVGMLAGIYLIVVIFAVFSDAAVRPQAVVFALAGMMLTAPLIIRALANVFRQRKK